MGQRILNDGDAGLDFRTKLNDNFTELFDNAQVFVSTRRATPASFALTTTPQTIPITDTVLYENIITYDPITGVFDVVDAGIYGFMFFLTAGWDNGEEIRITVNINGTPIDTAGIVLTGNGANNYIPIGIPAYGEAPANAQIEIQIATLTGSANIELMSGYLTLDLKAKI